MNAVVSYGARSAISRTRRIISKSDTASITLRGLERRSTRAWTCPECLVGRPARYVYTTNGLGARGGLRRQSSTSLRRGEDDRKPSPPSTVGESTKQPEGPEEPAELPSKTEHKRSELSKRLAVIMDNILARASIAGHHINVYTGTDYSGIEALKKDMVEQERKVRDQHQVVDTARLTNQEAHSRQGSAQKEIVGLLERKANWSPTDLERYMSLVRSEHTNDQAVQTARDNLAAAESELEAARSLLERLERKQYHEEQIWSDTIRRNSTWVTFGLMGLNIILLLAQIGIFEPYRRRKIVREVQRALDAKTLSTLEVERQVDQVVEPAGVPLEVVEEPEVTEVAEAPLTSTQSATDSKDAGKTALAAGEVLPGEAIPAPDPITSNELPLRQPETWSEVRKAYQETFQDLFSERVVQLKKVEVTTTALQGVATGVAAMGLLFVVFRPR